MKPNFPLRTPDCIGFVTPFVSYGKFIGSHRKRNTYRIELRFPFTGKCFMIYESNKKPILSNVSVISWLWSIFGLFGSICFYISMILLVIIELFTCFYIITLIKKYFITEAHESLSGYISLFLSLFGLVTLIRIFLL